MQEQNPLKRLKPSFSTFCPYDRKIAQDKKMLDGIISKSSSAEKELKLDLSLSTDF